MCTSVKVGLVTSSSRATPSPLMIPLVIVVLPLPSSPNKSTNTGAQRREASWRPISMVSSGEEETTSVDGIVPLSQEPGIRLRERIDKIGGHQGSLADSLRGHVAGETMQVHAEAEYALPVFGAQFRGQTGQHPGENVARPARGHSRITRRVDVGATIRRRQDGMKSFQNDESPPSLGRLERNFQTPRLNVACRRIKEPSHFSRMRRQRQQFRLSGPEFVRTPGKSVQPVGIEYDRKR